MINPCYKHPQALTIEHYIKSGKRKDGTQAYKCKYCVKELHRSHYERNKEKVLSKCAEYRTENPEKLAITKRNSYLKNKEKWAEAERFRRLKFDRASRSTLDDRYMKKLLCMGTDLARGDIPDELAEIKRYVVSLNRLIKRIKKNAVD